MGRMIAERLAEVHRRIAEAAERSARDPAGVELVAVSKRQPPEHLEAAYAAGHRVFGESRAQELVAHADVLPDDVSWHMVGHLQRNKAGVVAGIASALHSLDSERLARAWARTGSDVPVYVQVNLAEEPQKGGVLPDDLDGLLTVCADLPIPVIGLMALPPFDPDPEAARPWFRQLRGLRDTLGERHPTLRGLSMGMSGDFEVAIEEGSTSIRVGTTIFGPRLG
ncbi:MAG: YggS family pyridoxal phosphate-dependent enzyme [Acidimicrobiia bacterium]|nr:YggS family pyridoxal phosphate-dependent enzyme [Acidimicrobiia bacterium]